MTVKTIHQKDITILNLNIPHNIASKLAELKGETDESTIIRHPKYLSS